MTVNSRIKKWYIATYPTDELGEEINPKLTFGQLCNEMHVGKDVYKMLGVCDSVVRERVFEALAKVKNTTYEAIYNLWVDGVRLYGR